MWTDRQLAAQMRAAVLGHLPVRAFLRRDRGNGLFISNAPAFDDRPKEIPGFRTETCGNLLRIYPDAIWMAEIEKGFCGSRTDLAESLERFRGIAPSQQAMSLFCSGLKLLDAGEGASEAEIAAFDRDLRRLAARALRKELSGGGLYGLSLLDGMLKT